MIAIFVLAKHKQCACQLTSFESAQYICTQIANANRSILRSFGGCVSEHERRAHMEVYAIHSIDEQHTHTTHRRPTMQVSIAIQTHDAHARSADASGE